MILNLFRMINAPIRVAQTTAEDLSVRDEQGFYPTPGIRTLLIVCYIRKQLILVTHRIEVKKFFSTNYFHHKILRSSFIFMGI